MVKISVLFANKDGARFDMDYYTSKHMKLVADRMGAACKAIHAERGTAGAVAGSKPPFIAAGHLLFDTFDEMHDALGKCGRELMADIPNFTDVPPTVQVGEVLL